MVIDPQSYWWVTLFRVFQSFSFHLLNLLYISGPKLITGCLHVDHRSIRYTKATDSHRSFYKLPFVNSLQGQEAMAVSEFLESHTCLFIPVPQSGNCWLFSWPSCTSFTNSSYMCVYTCHSSSSVLILLRVTLLFMTETWMVNVLKLLYIEKPF